MWDESKCVEMSNTLAKNEQEHKSFRRRLDELEKEAQKQNGILVTLQRQGDAIENMTRALTEVKATVENIDKRVDSIEHEPADKWKKITFEIIKYIVIAAVGAAIAVIVKGV